MCIRDSRGSNAQIMLRDQITDWYMIFDLNGEGSVVGPPGGSMVTGGGILRLTDDWYHVAVRFAATGDVSLLTLRQLQSGPGVYLDVGETRFDAEE